MESKRALLGDRILWDSPTRLVFSLRALEGGSRVEFHVHTDNGMGVKTNLIARLSQNDTVTIDSFTTLQVESIAWNESWVNVQSDVTDSPTRAPTKVPTFPDGSFGTRSPWTHSPSEGTLMVDPPKPYDDDDDESPTLAQLFLIVALFCLAFAAISKLGSFIRARRAAQREQQHQDASFVNLQPISFETA